MKKEIIGLFLVFLLINGCTQTIQNQADQTAIATLTLKYSDANGAIILNKTIPVEKGANAFEALKDNVAMNYEMYEIGPFIKSIAGIEPPEKHYLGLYVNGEYADRALSGYTITEDTLIEWRTEKISDAW